MQKTFLSFNLMFFSNTLGSSSSTKIEHWAVKIRFCMVTSLFSFSRSDMMAAMKRLIMVTVPNKMRRMRRIMVKVLLVLSTLPLSPS